MGGSLYLAAGGAVMDLLAFTGDSQHRGLRYQPLVLVLAAVAVGIVADRCWPRPLAAWWVGSLASWAAWWCLSRCGRDRLAAVPLSVSLAALGAGWHHANWNLCPPDDLAAALSEASTPCCLTAMAADVPYPVPAPRPDPLTPFARGECTRLEVQVQAVRDGRGWRSARGRAILIVDGHLLGVAPGDRLQIVGRLSAPAPPRNPGSFDGQASARADGLRAWLRAESPDGVTLLERGGSRMLTGIWARLRGAAHRLLRHHLTYERQGLASALLLGLRHQLDVDHTTAFFETGTIHLLSISGLHVGILAGFLWFIVRLGWLRQGAALSVVAAVTLGYALLIDAQAPALRATVLVLWFCGAMALGRRTVAFNALAGAALVVLAVSPADLFRTGPQLSFLVAGTLIWLGPRFARWQTRDALERLILRTRPWPVRVARWLWRWWWRGTLISACVWAVSLPLVIERFHLVSPAAVVLTPLLTLPVAVGLIAGFCVLVLGVLAPPVAEAVALVCGASMGLTEAIIGWARTCPGSFTWVVGPDPWWVASFYLALLLAVAWPIARPGRRWRFGLLAAWAVVGAALPYTRPAPDFACTFLAVDHGCAVVLQLPDRQTLVYDAGHLGAPETVGRTVADFLWSRGIHRLDHVVISHADVDHFNAVPMLAQRFSIGRVWTSPAMLRDQGAATQALWQALARAAVRVETTWQGCVLIDRPDCRVCVLHPPEEGLADTDNANSVVLLIQYGPHRVLLTGDLERSGMTRLLAGPPQPCHVLLAPHHGSLRSDPPGFAAWCSPRWVVVSGDRDEQSQRAALTSAYHAAGAEVLHTAWSGAVTVRVAGDRLVVETFLRDDHAPVDPAAERPRYQAVQPPSTVTTAPVIYADAAETMNSTAP